MADLTNFVAAVDIGTTKIVTLIGRKTERNKVEIIDLKSVPSTGVKRGVVLNIDETVNAIQKTVSDVQSTTGIKFSNVFVGIAGQHIRSIRNRGYINRDSYEDQITKEDIDALVNDMYKIPIDAGEEIIHVLPQSFIVDNETGIKYPAGMSGKRLEANFHIVIGQVASARNIEKCITRVGLKNNGLILEPLASAEAVLTDDEKEAGVALVDIGGGTTDIAVYYDDIIRHTAVIPFGGNVVTRDIKEGCSILQRQAEALKIQFGSAIGDIAQEDKVVTIPGISGREPKEISFKSLAYIIQSRMEEIIEAVLFEIENSGVADKLSAGIVVTGGGAMLRHLPQLIKFKAGMDVRIGLPNEHLAGETRSEYIQPKYATSIGLILKGYEMLENNNKLKAEVHKDPGEIEKEIINHAEEPFKVDNKQKVNPISKKNLVKKGFFDNLKTHFNKIFDENDTEM